MVTQTVVFNNDKEDENARAFMGYTAYSKGTVAVEGLSAVNIPSSASKKIRFYKRISVILLLLTIVVGISLGILLYNYTRTLKNQNIQICTSEECLRSAANLRLSMDLKVDPCDDFYKFTCGRWGVEHPDNVWHYEYSNFETVKERTTTKLLAFLESNVSDSEPSPLKKMRDFYTSCTDTETVDLLGYTTLFNRLKELHLPTLPRFFRSKNSKNSSFDWVKHEAALMKTLGAGAFVGLFIGPNVYNTNENVIYMGVPDLDTLSPSLTRVENIQKQKQLRFKEITYSKDVLDILVFMLPKASNKDLDVWSVIKAARIIWNIKENLEIRTVYGILLSNQFKAIKINDILGNKGSSNNETYIIWRRYLTMVFDGISNVKLDLDNKDYIYTNEQQLVYLRNVVSYLSKLPDENIELYMWWVAVHTMIPSTPAYFSPGNSESFKASDLQKIRTKQCVDLVKNTMKFAATYAIADRDFLNNAKPKADEIVNNIKDAFGESVKDATWMDPDTKKLVLKKSENLIGLIGFPDWLLNRTMLEDYYSTIKIQNNTLSDNIIGFITANTHLNLASLRKRNARTWKDQSPVEVNAHNYLSSNVLVLPMAFLTHPFYNLGLESLNYGALGSLIGHEFIHGFDFDGIKFDAWGNQKEWMNNEVTRKFIRRLFCYVEQYDYFSVPVINKTVNSFQTLSENLADNEGLRLAFSAYKHNKYGKEPNLPGFESFSEDQMFFIAFASIWCGTTDTDLLEYAIEIDEHSPKSIRVMGSLQNSYEFANTFKCPIGSKLNPNRTRCKAW